jgi:hypothetical protein
MPGPRVLIAFMAAVSLLAAGCSSGATPAAVSPSASPAPRPTEPPVPTATARDAVSTTTVSEGGIRVGRATSGAELRVDQGSYGCAPRIFVRGSSLPSNANVQLRWDVDDTPLAEVTTSSDGTFVVWLEDAYPGDCGPGSAYVLSATTSGGVILVSAELPVPEFFRARLAVRPAAGGCGEVVIGVFNMRPRRPVVIHARRYRAEDGAAQVIATLEADRDGNAASDSIVNPWPCDGGPVELSASVGGDLRSAPWVTRPYLVDR